MTKLNFHYRTIDILVPVMIGVAFGVAFWGYAQIYNLLDPVFATFKPAQGLLTGFWCLPALLALLIVRKPGAALSAEIIAASIAALLGSSFGLASIMSGIIQGIGFEIVFALVGFKYVNTLVIIASSLLSTFFEWLYEINVWYYEWGWDWKLIMLGFFWISALVLLAGLGVLLTNLLAKAGAINQFPPGREYLQDGKVGSSSPVWVKE